MITGKKKLISIILALALVVGLAGVWSGMTAEAKYVVPNEYVWEGFEDIDSDEAENDIQEPNIDPTDESCYLIGTASELAWVAFQSYNGETFEDVSFKLTACIDLGSKWWLPIGSIGNAFAGTFDGQGHTIYNLAVDENIINITSEGIGLFGCADGAAIKNVVVQGDISLSETGSCYVGGILGYAVSGVTISNCRNEVNISADYNVGGIVGNVESEITISGCSNYGSLEASEEGLGGILGYSDDCYAEIKNCYNRGQIGTGDASYAGGLIGYLGSDTWIDLYTSFCDGTVADGEMTGCIVGYEGAPCYNITTFENVYCVNNEDAPKCLNRVAGSGEWEYAKHVTTDITECEDDLGNAYTTAVITVNGEKQDKTLVLAWEADTEPEDKYDNAPSIADTIAAVKKTLEGFQNADKYKADYDETAWTTIQTVVAKCLAELEEGNFKTTDDVYDVVDDAVEAVQEYWQNRFDAKEILSEESYTKSEWEKINSTKAAAETALKNADDTCMDTLPAKIKAFEAAVDAGKITAAKTAAATELDAYAETAKAALDTVEKTEDYEKYLIMQKNVAAQIEAGKATIASVRTKDYNITMNKATTLTDVEKVISEYKALINEAKAAAITNITAAQNFAEIGTKEELLAFAKAYNEGGAGNVKLKADIVLDSASTWAAIGTQTNPYTGVFLGDGHSVSGLNINNLSTDYVGFFGYLGDAQIEGLSVEGTITAKRYCGGIAGYVNNGAEVVLKDCSSNVNITANYYSGGILGYVSGTETLPSKLTMTNCTNQGSVSATSTSGTYGTGGLVGSIDYATAEIAGCKNKGTVSAKASYTGGIVGRTSYSDLTISGALNTGAVSAGTSSYAGGILGGVYQFPVQTVISASANEETVTAKQYCGGIAGRIGGEVQILNCGNYASVGTKASGYQYQGGIVGDLDIAQNTSYSNGTIQNIYNEGIVYGYIYLGGLFGSSTAKYSTSTNHISVKNGYSKVQPESNAVAADVEKYVGSVLGAGGYYEEGIYIANKFESCYGPAPTSGTSNTSVYSTGLISSTDMTQTALLSALGSEFVATDSGLDLKWHADYIIGEALKQAREEANKELSKYQEKDYYETQWQQLKTIRDKAQTEVDAAKTATDVNELLKTAKKQMNQIAKKETVDAALAAAKGSYAAQVDTYGSTEGFQNKLRQQLEDSSKRKNAITAAKEAIEAVKVADYSKTYATEKQNQLFDNILKTAKTAISEVILLNGGWDGETVQEPAKSGNIYQITNGAELAWIAQQCNTEKKSASAVLCKDIDLGGRLWTPIGINGSHMYSSAAFDGQGYTVYGLNVEAGEKGQYSGLFGEISASTIQNLTVYGTVKGGTYTTYGQYVGGIAGAMQASSIIKNCVSYVTVENTVTNASSDIFLGGIVGYCTNSTVTACENRGKVGNRTGGSNVGGITGCLNSDALVSFCSNYGQVGSGKGTCVGGIAGWIRTGSAVRQSFNMAVVSGSNIAGGIAGKMGNTSIDNQGDNYLTECYNRGAVSGSIVGGIVGQMRDETSYTQVSSSNPIVANTYHAAQITGETYGGIVGNFQCGTLENNYVSTESAGRIYGENGNIFTSMQGTNALTNALPTAGHTMLGGSFCKDLDDEQKNGGYPILIWQSATAELRTEIFDAIGELEVAWLTFNNEYYKYGTQYVKLQELVTEYSTKLTQAQSSEEITELVKEANEKLAEVKTELEVAQETAITALQASFNKKDDKCSDSDQTKLENLLAEAKKAISQVKITSGDDTLNTSAKAVGKVNSLQKKYQDQMDAIQTLEESALLEAKDEALAQLATAYEKLLEDNVYTDEGKVQLEKAKTKAETAINACADTDAVTTALSKGLQAMNKVPVDTSSWEAEDLYESLKTALEERVTELTESDLYAEAQIKELNDLNTTYQAKLKEALDAEDTEADAKKTAIQAVYDKAIKELGEVQTKEAVAVEALAKAKEDAKTGWAQKNTELQTEHAEVLTATDKARMNELLATYLSALDNVATLEQVTGLQTELEAKWDEIVALANDENAWRGETAENAPETAEDNEGNVWYLIDTAAELKWLADNRNNGTLTTTNVKLTADIDLANQAWTPIGTENKPFIGLFNGDGHTVSNLYIAAREQDNLGLFGAAKSSTIEGLTVTGTIQAAKAEKVGGILGAGESVCISNCTSKVNLVVSSDKPLTSGRTGIGGIAGYLTGDQTNVTISTYEGTIQATPANADNNVPAAVGGIVGWMEFGTGNAIEQCINNGSVLTENGKYVGGIVGCLEDNSKSSAATMAIRYCANHGAVTGVDALGGMVGYVDAGQPIEVSWVYNTGNVSGNTGKTITNVGGIFGQVTGNDITLARAYNKVMVNKDLSGDNVGALVGSAENGTFSTALYALEGTAGNLFGFTPAAGASASFVTAEQAVSGELAAALNSGTIYTNFKSVAGKNDTCPVLWFEVTFEDEKNAAAKELEQIFAQTYLEENYYEEQWKELNNLLTQKKDAIKAAANAEQLAAAKSPDMTDMAQVQTKVQVLAAAIQAAKDELTGKYDEYYAKIDSYLASNWVTIQTAYNSGLAAIEAATDPTAAAEAKDTALAAMAEVKPKEEEGQDPDSGDQAVENVIKLIDDIGEVSLDSLTKIQTAENAYKALTEEQLAKVTNYETLTKARERYEELVKEATGGDADAADKAKAELVDYLIQNLGEITAASGSAITNARTAYDNLTDAQKALVTKLETLKAAETAYDTACIKQFYDAYTAIGSTVTDSSGTAIETARKIYDSLTDAQKEKVEAKYVTSLEKAEADYKDIQAAVAVASKIQAIGTVSSGSKNAIQTAKSAYDALTDSQKSYLNSLGYVTVLNNAINTYNDMAAADEAEALIASIGTVTANSGTVIKQARAAYDALTDTQKAYVSSAYYTILTTAEYKYAALTSSGTTANVTGSLITPGLLGGSLLDTPLYSTGTNSSLLDSLLSSGTGTTTGGLNSALSGNMGSSLSGGLGSSLGSGIQSGSVGNGSQSGSLSATGSNVSESEQSTTTNTTTNTTTSTTTGGAAAGTLTGQAGIETTANADSTETIWKTVEIILAILLVVLLLVGTAAVFYTAGNKRKERFNDMM